MSDRIKEAFEVLIEQMEEPPTWEELSTLDDIVITSTPRKHEPEPGISIRRGPLVAMVAGGLVILVAALGLLLGPGKAPVGAESIVDEVISSAEGPAHIAVGFDSDGELCAQAGSATQGELVCGGDGLAAVGFQAYTHLAVAGFAPNSTEEINLIFDDGRRRPVDLVPVPGRDAYAFGSVIRIQPGSVELEVTDGQGVVVDRHSILVGSIADALGWETVPIPDGVEPEPMDAVWTGTELIFWGGYAYAPDARSWRELPSLGDWASFIATSGVWTGTEAIFCCGGGTVAVRGFEAFHKTSNAPFRLDPAVEAVWTGDLMLVAAEGEGVAAYDPDRDTWELLAETPTGNGFGGFFEVAWTGSELIVWTENEIGDALDPETRSWRTLPYPPDTLRGTFTHDDLAYTGDELIIWGLSPSQGGVGAMLDLQTDQWVELPAPLPDPKPCECDLRGGQTIVWTGESLLISTSRLSGDIDTSEPALIAYHPDSNRWTYEGASPLGWDFGQLREWGERAFMAGDQVVLRSDKNLYISPPGWQPQGPPIPPDGLYAVERLFSQP